jgi:ribonuclease D
MPYLTEASEIAAAISECAKASTLWVDTEIADYLSETPRLSLIQVLDDRSDRTGERVCVLDVLDRPELAAAFIERIMVSASIEKVFHNAAYDLRFLGEDLAQNVTCTWEMARKLPAYLLPVRNLKLKTLAVQLCQLPEVEKSEQQSDWGQRPLSENQLYYATMDPVYLAHVHRLLLDLARESVWEPATEDIAAVSQRYWELKHQLKLINSEVSYLEKRLKDAMLVQGVTETEHWKLCGEERVNVRVPFSELAKVVIKWGLGLDFTVTLTKQMRSQLGTFAGELPLVKERVVNWRLHAKRHRDEGDEESEE